MFVDVIFVLNLICAIFRVKISLWMSKKERKCCPNLVQCLLFKLVVCGCLNLVQCLMSEETYLKTIVITDDLSYYIH